MSSFQRGHHSIDHLKMVPGIITLQDRFHNRHAHPSLENPGALYPLYTPAEDIITIYSLFF